MRVAFNLAATTIRVQMQRLILGLTLAFTAMSGCASLAFGPEVSTTNPSREQVDYCRKVMYVHPELKITPLGFRLASGIDEAIWFKFVAHTEDPNEVFQSPPVDPSELRPGFRFSSPTGESWWDAASQSMVGGSFALPTAKYLNAGIVDNSNGTLTVFVMWHET